jgi:hypothetical protein
MNIDSKKCEFGYELQLVIPYAYYLFINNKLNNTISCLNTKELYYFSQNHNEIYENRNWVSPDVPNKTPHVKELNYEEYINPPYKNIFKNTYFVYDKPILIIHNKYNTEWDNEPINYIDKKTLSEIFKYCNDKYKIIYIRPLNKNIIGDNSKVYDLNEESILYKYNITDANKLYIEIKDKYNINNFNHFQLLLHSNSNYFISVQGGNCVLASYFGGINIIYAKKGHELRCNSYNGHYKKYSNSNILHTNNYIDLIKIIKNNF